MLNTTNHANPNDNLNILNEVISKAKDKHLPVRMIKFSKYKHGKSQWITKGIIRSNPVNCLQRQIIYEIKTNTYRF